MRNGEVRVNGNGPSEASLAEALRSIACQLKWLGNGSAGTEMGAIEGLGIAIERGFDVLAVAVREHADAVQRLADCLEARES